MDPGDQREPSRAEGAGLAEFVRFQREAILQDWEQAIRQIPIARTLGHRALLNHLPSLLEHIASMIEDVEHGQPARPTSSDADIHAIERLQEGYDLGAIVQEFSLLRECVLRRWHQFGQGSSGGPVLNRAIDQAVSASVSKYVNARDRTLVALDRISAAALEHVDLDAFLRSLTQVLIETTPSVDSVAIFLREGENDMRLHAAVGLEAALPSDYRMRIGTGCAGTIAARAAPLELHDAASSALVTEALRRRGTRAFYGVPMLHHGKVVGVAHIASCSAYEFSNEDKILFRAMVERATLLVVQAQLGLRERESRQQAEAALEALHAQRALSQSLLDAQDSVGEGLVIVQHGQMLHVNEAFCNICGYSVDELVQLGNLQPLIVPEQHDAVLRRFEGIRDGTERATRTEIAIRHKSGRRVELDLSVSRLPDGSVLALSRDITERKEAEAALRATQEQLARNEALLRTIVESMPVGVWVADESGRLILGNEASRRIWAGQRLVGMDEYNEYLAWWADSGQRVQTDDWTLSRVLRNRQPALNEILRIQAFDGTEHYIRNSAVPLRDAQGQFRGAIAVNEDITELKRAEEALQRALGEYRTLAEAMPILVWTATPDGSLDYGNQVLADYIGTKAEEIYGTGWRRFIHPDDLSQMTERWAHSISTGEDLVTEYRLRRADGVYRWFLIRAKPMRAEGRQQIVKWFGTCTDIHDLKELQAEAQRRARFAQQLIGIVSHDLRNPISAITLGIQSLVRREDLDERQLKALTRVLSAADRANRMVRDLLDFTQAGLRGGIPVERKPLNLHHLVRHVVEEVQAAYPERCINVSRTGDGLGEWDGDRMAQVITNLVTNALRYSPEDSCVSVEAGTLDGSMELRVHNWGEPISPEVLPRIFLPMERGAQQADVAGRNIGLGLFIVDQIVRAHHGTISVVSNAAEGTTFTVRLPRSG